MGANDTQGMIEDGRVLVFGSAEWRVEYEKRVKQLLESSRKAGARFAWVGLPQMKNKTYNKKVAVINEVCRNVMEAGGGMFVPTESYSSSGGVDIAGRVENNLRSDDGIHFNLKGSRIVAKNVMSHLSRQM